MISNNKSTPLMFYVVNFLFPKNKYHLILITLSILILGFSEIFVDFIDKGDKILIEGLAFFIIVLYLGFLSFDFLEKNKTLESIELIQTDNNEIEAKSNETKEREDILKIKEKIEEYGPSESIFVIFNIFRNRTLNEIKNLSTRASLNGAIGIVISGIGVIFMFLSFFNDISNNNINIQGSNIENTTILLIFLISFLPKIFFIILIEVFAFFFLNLYRKTLDEIKYFQNEMTNFELKISALMFVLKAKVDDEKTKDKIIENLIKTERNISLMILDNKKEILDKSTFKKIMDYLDKILNFHKEKNDNDQKNN